TSMDLPPLVVGLFCAGALAASMSSGDAIVHAASAVVVKDFYKVLVRPDIDDRRETWLIKVMVVVIGAVAYYFAIYSELSLVLLLLLSYGALAQIFPAVLAALYWRRSTPAGVLGGLLAGCLVTLVWNLFPALQWLDIHPGIWGLAVNVTVMVVMSFATPPMSEEHVGTFVNA
ncbi:MAG: hypothetical protein QF786_12310, partial [Vicinamibacterales bacterium]|nr:hypothetical protein [Vicinamibacterales bacterium]